MSSDPAPAAPPAAPSVADAQAVEAALAALRRDGNNALANKIARYRAARAASLASGVRTHDEIVAALAGERPQALVLMAVMQLLHRQALQRASLSLALLAALEQLMLDSMRRGVRRAPAEFGLPDEDIEALAQRISQELAEAARVGEALGSALDAVEHAEAAIAREDSARLLAGLARIHGDSIERYLARVERSHSAVQAAIAMRLMGGRRSGRISEPQATPAPAP